MNIKIVFDINHKTGEIDIVVSLDGSELNPKEATQLTGTKTKDCAQYILEWDVPAP